MKIFVFLSTICFLQFIKSAIKKFQFQPNSNDSYVKASVYLDNQTGKYRFSENYDENAVAYGMFTKKLETDGWDYLSISSNIEPRYNATTKAFAMGFLEGILTRDSIFSHYINMKHNSMFSSNNQMPEFMKKFFQNHHNYIIQMYNSFPSDIYWANAYTIFMQLKGMVDGYNSVQEKDKQIDIIDFHIIASTPELDDIMNSDIHHRKNISAMTLNEILNYIDSRSHCSVLFKLSPDFSELYLGHNTWTSFNSMNRIFKEYRFKAGIENSFTMAFSSYPGALNSIDDFYVTDNDLLVTETTNEVFDESLFDKISPNSLLTWERAMIANRLATDAKSWTEIFARYNSGTYNNQFMIVDLKLVDLENKAIKDNAFWIIEQIPGYTEAADMTQILRYGYWPSYNSAYFKTIRELSKYQEQILKFPELRDHIDYSTCARANIFRRDNPLVTDLDQMMKLLRYNNYKNDVLSKNNPTLAISERKDLNENSPDCIGGIDTKIVKLSDLKNSKQKKIYIVSGPTSDNLPVFQFSKANCDVKYLKLGLPDKYEFDWIEYTTNLFDIEETKIEADY